MSPLSSWFTEGPGKRGHIVADTLLSTQMFPRLPSRTTVVADTNFVSGTQKVFLILFRNILCPQQMFPSLRSPRNIMGNKVSATMCPRLPGPLSSLTGSATSTRKAVRATVSHSCISQDIKQTGFYLVSSSFALINETPFHLLHVWWGRSTKIKTSVTDILDNFLYERT